MPNFLKNPCSGSRVAACGRA